MPGVSCEERIMKSMARRDVLKQGGAVLAPGTASSASLVAKAQTPSSAQNAQATRDRPTLIEDIAHWLVELRYENTPADIVARAC